MSKRFTITEKWDSVWYRKLSTVHKCFYEYLHNRCSHSGIWEVDFETASHYIGAILNPEEVKELFSDMIYELDGGKRWFLINYIEVQHKGVLNPNNPAQKKAYQELLGLGLLNKDGTLKPLLSSLSVPKEEETLKEKIQDIVSDKEIVLTQNRETVKEKDTINILNIGVKKSTDKEKPKNMKTYTPEELEEMELVRISKGKKLRYDSNDSYCGEPDGFL